MLKEKISQRTKGKEQLVIAAIKNGAYSRDDIMQLTGFPYILVCQCLRNLVEEYNVPNFGCLMKILAPLKQPSTVSKFTSHNCVIVDKALRPALAADMLVQVLGRDYCSNLIDALMVACVPGAADEGEEKAV